MDLSEFKVVLIHGNGGGVSTDHWFPQLKKNLEEFGFKVDARNFPDNEVAHESIWLPFIKNEIKTDENTILIGHSSGAVASMRYAEKNKIYGSILVGCNYTDLGDSSEKESGYYNHPWDWNSIKNNQKWIMQFASSDDPYIPIEQPRFIHKHLNSDYYEFSNKGHFQTKDFPELIEAIKLMF
jgi:serine hydrolase